MLRQCPICDGYEVIDRRVAVIGDGAHAAGEALFLRAYTPQLTLVTLGRPLDVSREARDRLEARGVVDVADRLGDDGSLDLAGSQGAMRGSTGYTSATTAHAIAGRFSEAEFARLAAHADADGRPQRGRRGRYAGHRGSPRGAPGCRQADQDVDQPRQQRPGAEDRCDEVEVEQADEAPVQAADDDQQQGEQMSKPFIAFSIVRGCADSVIRPAASPPRR